MMLSTLPVAVSSLLFLLVASTELFNLPIYDSNSPFVQHEISKAKQQLTSQGAFKLENFLSKEAISSIKSQFEHINSQHSIVFPEVHRNIFQKYTINPELPLTHPFNQLLYNRIGFIGTKILTQNNENNLFSQIYNSSSLHNFLSEIANVQLYPSKDEHGSIYGLIGRDNDRGAWHFDEHPFSCVWNVHKPQFGGQFKYVRFDPKKKDTNNNNNNNDDEWEWDVELLDKVLKYDNDTTNQDINSNNNDDNDNDDDSNNVNIITIDAQVGDVYCFWGNVSLHSVVEIKDDSDYNMARQVFVTAFSTDANFKHSDSVHELNDWDGKNRNVYYNDNENNGKMEL